MKRPEQVNYQSFSPNSQPNILEPGWEQLSSPIPEYNTRPSLPDLITDLRTNWFNLGLPEDWYNLHTLGEKQVGFSMDKQINLLGDLTPSGVSLWLERTDADLRGFCLEYLSKHHRLYPAEYKKRVNNGKIELFNPRYQKDITDTAQLAEREGIVVEQLYRIKSFFTDDNTPVGSLVVMVSPLGPTGMNTDNGTPITYPDSFMFLFNKTETDRVTAFGLQTDFTKEECREVILRLAKVRLTKDAKESSYIRETAFIVPDTRDDLQSVEDILKIFAQVRLDLSGGTSYHVYKDEDWYCVTEDLKRWNELYYFGSEVETILGEFNDYARSIIEQAGPENLDRNLREAVAGTILLLTRHFGEQKLQKSKSQSTVLPTSTALAFCNEEGPVAVFPNIRYSNSFSIHQRSWADWMEDAADQPGCAGGGSTSSGPKTITESIVNRPVDVTQTDQANSDNYETATCVVCGKTTLCGKCSKRCKDGCEPEWFRENGITE